MLWTRAVYALNELVQASSRDAEEAKQIAAALLRKVSSSNPTVKWKVRLCHLPAPRHSHPLGVLPRHPHKPGTAPPSSATCRSCKRACEHLVLPRAQAK